MTGQLRVWSHVRGNNPDVIKFESSAEGYVSLQGKRKLD